MICFVTHEGIRLIQFFSPKTIALIGATDRRGNVGDAILKNLSGFDGLSMLPKAVVRLAIHTIRVAAKPTQGFTSHG